MENNVQNNGMQQYIQQLLSRQMTLNKLYQNPELMNPSFSYNGNQNLLNYINMMQAASMMNNNSVHDNRPTVDQLQLLMMLRLKSNYGINNFQNSPMNATNFNSLNNASLNHNEPINYGFVPMEPIDHQESRGQKSLPLKKRLMYNSNGQDPSSMSPVSFTSSETPTSLSPTPNYSYNEKILGGLQDANQLGEKPKRMLSDQPKKSKLLLEELNVLFSMS